MSKIQDDQDHLATLTMDELRDETVKRLLDLDDCLITELANFADDPESVDAAARVATMRAFFDKYHPALMRYLEFLGQRLH